MPKDFKRYTVTAALPYTNGPIHIGHLAGVYVPADIYVRYLRGRGKDVVFVSGSDEHGVAITMKARKEGISPQDIIDKYHPMIKSSFEEFGISLDIYHRTSSKTHHETASEFFKNLSDQGVFDEKSNQQYYDDKEKQFLADRYIIGTCPNCKFDEAYGDQCENCGTSLSPDELIDPKSALSGDKPILRETKHWYLPLNNYEDWLKEWLIKGHKSDWKSNVYGQCKSWIDNGLQPRAVTRDLDWGIPVPVEGGEGKVLYVWFDAPIGYISATKDWAKEVGKDWKDYWQSEDTRLIHFIGKDNIVFHCIIFPVILKAHGEYILPDNVPANEFLNLEGQKLSTSKNWAVWLHEYLEDFPGKQDIMRYVLTAIGPEAKDSDFTWKDFQSRINNELVAIFGNFVNRAMVLVHKYFDGKVPPTTDSFKIDKDLVSEVETLKEKIESSLEEFKFREALSYYIDIARAGNKYLAETEPWHLIKTDGERVKSILNLSMQIVANLSILGKPFLPFSIVKISEMIRLENLDWDLAGKLNLLPDNHELGKPELLFDRIEDDQIEKQIEKLRSNTLNNKKTVALQKNEISYDDFMGMDIRIGTILKAEKVEKSNKLLKLKIDTGMDQRIVVSGIAQFFNPEEIIGRQVTVLANLASREIMGIESQGMVLMAEDKNGTLQFIEPSESITNGSQVS